jgi:predicted transcriptional regulator
MKTKIFTDGFEGWAKRGRSRAKAIDEGRRITPTKEITFENAAEMARLLTPARIDLFECVKQRALPMKDLAASLKRDVRAVSRDVSALEKYGIVESEHVVNPGHGRVRVVSAPASVVISAQL